MSIDVCLLSCMIFLFGYFANSNEKNNKNSSCDNYIDVKVDTAAINERKILFATKDMLDATFLSPKELAEKLSLNSILESKDGEFILLGKQNDNYIVICYYLGGDNAIYYIGCIKTKLFSLENGINISPTWFNLGPGEFYCIKRKFVLYTDYLLKIESEEKNEKNITLKKYTNSYRINDKGKFYEVKE